jgi:hypothetical protein
MTQCWKKYCKNKKRGTKISVSQYPAGKEMYQRHLTVAAGIKETRQRTGEDKESLRSDN